MTSKDLICTLITVVWSERQRQNTLGGHFQDFWVDDHLRLFLTRQSLSVPFFGLAPQVGATVHAGNVEYSNPLQRQAAEIQWSTAALRKVQQSEASVRCLSVGTVLSLQTVCFKEMCNVAATFSPQLLDFRSVSCRKQRWFLKWQIQNTTACSSFCSHREMCLSGLSDTSLSQYIFSFQHTQEEESSCNTCCHRHLLSPPAFSFFSFKKQ